MFFFNASVVSLPYAPWRALLLGLSALAAAVTLWQHQFELRIKSECAENRNLVQLLNQTPSPTTSIAQDFLGSLSQAITSRSIVDTFQRAAQAAGVAVSSLTLRQSASRADQLGRLELTVTAQGSYSALKQLLAEWLGRFPSATVRAQQWRRVDISGAPGAGTVAVEVNWVLSVWTRPVGIDVSTRPLSDVPPLAAPARSSTAAR